ncbi:MAG: hypothetical protein PUB22_03955 [Clostridiales bacterium]|nr:hypothetical protein [Clostridiales bacterium]
MIQVVTVCILIYLGIRHTVTTTGLALIMGEMIWIFHGKNCR